MNSKWESNDLRGTVPACKSRFPNSDALVPDAMKTEGRFHYHFPDGDSQKLSLPDEWSLATLYN